MVNKIELAILNHDYTWETKIVDIDASIDRFDVDAVAAWITATQYGLPEHRNAALIVVYNNDPCDCELCEEDDES